MPSNTTELADLERERLESLVALVFEPGHYNPACGCQTCVGTREDLNQEDLQFVNKLSTAVGSERA